ncbi:MAG: cupredoxin domain-containing protein [Acidimicrobiales bacterium]
MAVIAAALLLAIMLAACGGSDSGNAGGTSTTSTTENPEEYGGSTGGTSAGAKVVAKDFSLTSLSVASGAAVTFENEGKATHTMTADDGSFDTDRVSPGATATVTAPTKAGSYAFHCKIHPSMTATLTVTS